MTAGEEKIYEAIMELREEVAVYKTQQENLEKVVSEHDGHIETSKADRNKFLGIAMVGGAMGGLGFFAWIGSLIVHYLTTKS